MRSIRALKSLTLENNSDVNQIKCISPSSSYPSLSSMTNVQLLTPEGCYFVTVFSSCYVGHKRITRPQVSNEGDDLQPRRIDSNMLNEQFRHWIRGDFKLRKLGEVFYSLALKTFQVTKCIIELWVYVHCLPHDKVQLYIDVNTIVKLLILWKIARLCVNRFPLLVQWILVIWDFLGLVLSKSQVIR
jgi:hypothetical protein